MYFAYGEQEIGYLAGRDKKLGEAMRYIGPIEREVDEDLFSAVVHQIVGQQISTAALNTVWGRFQEALCGVTPARVCALGQKGLQGLGISYRKAEYIYDFAAKVQSGAFDIEALWEQSDAEVIARLTALRGIGIWTAEMLLIFCMQRPDVLSFGDLAILRGMRMLYHHRSISREKFEVYRRRYSPYGSVASLYLWAVAGGAIPDMRDYAPAVKKQKKGSKA